MVLANQWWMRFLNLLLPPSASSTKDSKLSLEGEKAAAALNKTSIKALDLQSTFNFLFVH